MWHCNFPHNHQHDDQDDDDQDDDDEDTVILAGRGPQTVWMEERWVRFDEGRRLLTIVKIS